MHGDCIALDNYAAGAAACRSGRAASGRGSRRMTLATVIAGPVIAGSVVITTITMIIITYSFSKIISSFEFGVKS